MLAILDDGNESVIRFPGISHVWTAGCVSKLEAGGFILVQSWYIRALQRGLISSLKNILVQFRWFYSRVKDVLIQTHGKFALQKFYFRDFLAFINYQNFFLMVARPIFHVKYFNKYHVLVLKNTLLSYFITHQSVCNDFNSNQSTWVIFAFYLLTVWKHFSTQSFIDWIILWVLTP